LATPYVQVCLARLPADTYLCYAAGRRTCRSGTLLATMCMQVCPKFPLTTPFVCRREEDVQIVDAADRGDLLATYYAVATKGVDRCGLLEHCTPVANPSVYRVPMHTWMTS
jgi:hypothetical protein